MWKSRVSGLLIAVAGGGLMGFLWWQVLDRSNFGEFIYRVGIPGVLILAAIGTMAVVFGVHLLVAPQSAIRRWTPRIARKG